mmetsp:Transcript_102103/g.202704  ORF Transcript_102103/g.202704 Transcript_102103/m.202704 type:complete len:220 (+) Transcript_102103:817-1476(+)
MSGSNSLFGRTASWQEPSGRTLDGIAPPTLVLPESHALVFLDPMPLGYPLEAWYAERVPVVPLWGLSPQSSRRFFSTAPGSCLSIDMRCPRLLGTVGMFAGWSGSCLGGSCLGDCAMLECSDPACERSSSTSSVGDNLCLAAVEPSLVSSQFGRCRKGNLSTNKSFVAGRSQSEEAFDPTGRAPTSAGELTSFAATGPALPWCRLVAGAGSVPSGFSTE